MSMTRCPYCRRTYRGGFWRGLWHALFCNYDPKDYG